MEKEKTTADKVCVALSDFSRVYAVLTPLERKELIRLVLKRAKMGDRQIVLELYPIEGLEMEAAQSRSRSEPPDWLPGLVPQSVLRDVFATHLPSLSRWIRRARRRFHESFSGLNERDNASLCMKYLPLLRTTVPKLGG